MSREVLLKVKNIQAQDTHGYSLKMENDGSPLKTFLSCDACGNPLRAYKSKKIQKYYYKCSTKGCGCDKRADELHARFKSYWDLGDYADKQLIQNPVFPEGMYYNRENDQCSTSRINSLFAYMAALARVLQHKKAGNSTLESLAAGPVERSGEISNFFVEGLRVIEMLLGH